MARGQAFSKLNFAAGQSVTVTPATPALNLLGLRTVGITIRLSSNSTGTLAGSFQIQVTDFGYDETNTPPLSTDWVLYTGSSQTWAGTPLVYSLANIGQKFLRVVFTNSSSTGAPLVDMAVTGNYSTDV